MLKDLRHAVRLLWQARGWTTIVVLSLALGIGANTALFSAINGLLLTSLPVKDPDTLVRFRFSGRNDMVTSSSGYGFLKPAADGHARPGVVLVPDVPAVRRRQPDDDGPLRLRAVRPRQRRRRRPGGDRHPHSSRRATTTRSSVSPRARAARSCPRTIDRPRRRSPSSAPSTGIRASEPIPPWSERSSRSTTSR